MPRYTAQIEKSKRDRFDLVEKQRKLFDRAEVEKRDLNTEERAEFDALNGSVEQHEKRISDMEKINKEDEGGDEAEGDDLADDTTSSRSGGRPALETRSGTGNRDKETRAHASKAYRDAFRTYLATGERRDVTMSPNSAGGYLLAPVKTSEDVVKQCDNLVFIRPRARMYKVDNAQALGVRQMTTRVSDPAWTTEVGQLTPETSLAFNRRDLTPNLLAKLVTESVRLLISGVDVESIINEELAYKFSVAQENAFLNGSGAGQPLGAFVASASGIPATQDYPSTGAATFTADDLIGMRYFIKQPYLTDMKKAAWIFNRTIVAKIRTLKDSYGQYLWRPGFAENAPDTILDIPYGVSEYAPNTVATGNYAGILGNWGYYAIAELKDLWIQRLNERYADINEVGFIGRTYLDAAPVLGEAFVRLKLS
jgi:HK97 family phage major capsid protein